MVKPRQFFLIGLLAWPSPSIGFAVELSAIVGTPVQLEESVPHTGALRKVMRVIDGDTIVVSPNEKVRLIGVDTPETKDPRNPVACFGQEAAKFTRNAVEGKSVRLVFDENNQRTRHKDRYARTLAYAYLDDGRMLNRELIRQAYAHAYTRFRFRYLGEFRELEKTARAESLGLWASCPL